MIVVVEAVKKRWPGARRPRIGWEVDTQDPDVFLAVRDALALEDLKPSRGGEKVRFQIVNGTAVRITQATTNSNPAPSPIR